MQRFAAYLILFCISSAFISCNQQQTEQYFKQAVLIEKKQDSLLNYFRSPTIREIPEICEQAEQQITKVQREHQDTLNKQKAEDLLQLHYLCESQKKIIPFNRKIYDQLVLQKKQIKLLQANIKEKKLNPEKIQEGLTHEQKAIDLFVKEVERSDSIIKINVKKQKELLERIVTFIPPQ